MPRQIDNRATDCRVYRCYSAEFLELDKLFPRSVNVAVYF